MSASRPTSVDKVEPRHPPAQEEVLGPTALGLTAAVIAQQLGIALRTANELDDEMVHCNACTTGRDHLIPSGGAGDSSYGPPGQGTAARLFWSKSRTMSWESS